MRLRNGMAGLLCVAFLLSCLPLATAAFTDIKDDTTAENVQILQMMGIVSGMSNGLFDPDGGLTRAQFTKMAVTAQGKAEQAPGMKSFTIFPDVKSSHWASGYINLAVRGEAKFISGFADGSFGPEKRINYGEAVTILMRLLGYKDADVGLVWPTAYLTQATAIGLCDGVSLSGSDLITRAQAAQLFVNLLRTPVKIETGTGLPFGETVAGSVKKDSLVLNASAKTDQDVLALETAEGKFELLVQQPPTFLQGRRGTLLLDKKDRVIGFLPSTNSSAKEIVVSVAKAGSITDKSGKEYTVPGDVKAYYKGKEMTYAEVFINLRSGMRVTLHLGATAKVESIFVAERTAEDAVMIAKDGDGSRLGALTGDRKDYVIYRNGEVVKAAALKAYDVATYSSTENAIQISNFRLSGRYDNAYPNAKAPTKLTMLGHEFPVLSSAVSTLSSFKVGDQMTILLTKDGQVAGAAESNKLPSNSVGIATVKGSEATVEMTEGLTLKGSVDGGGKEYDGQLVRVSSWREGSLTLTAVGQNSNRDTLNLATQLLGKHSMAANVQVYERVKTGPVLAIDLNDIRMATVPAGQVLYSRLNDAGKVDLLILDNVTGDAFRYGRVYVSRINQEEPGDDGTEVVTIKTPTGDIGPYLNGNLRSGEWGGMVEDKASKRAVAYAKLERITQVSNQQWESEDHVMVDNTSYLVSKQVICYNSTTGQWVTLSVARAFGDSMTLYVDDFDVVRIIEVG